MTQASADLESAATEITGAANYLALFGPGGNDPAAHVKQTYRRFSRLVHPDLHMNGNYHRAEAVFKRLGELYADAERAIDANNYGRTTAVTVKTRRATHVVADLLGYGDLSATYGALSHIGGRERQTFLKVVQRPGDRDLLQTEAIALKRLRGAGTDPDLHPFVTELVDSFVYAETGKPRRQANVLGRLEGFVTLEQIKQAFPGGLDPLHAAWIWRRLLVALGFAHDNNVVHGAVLPSHVMVLPPQHGVVLADWCYASLRDDSHADYPPIKAIVNRYQKWYPAEVQAKLAPGPATDLMMAARCMVDVMGGDALTGNLPDRVPRALRAFFKGCLPRALSQRPQNAWQLLGEFDELLARMGPPYFPRKFRIFTMPAGTV